MFNRSNIIAMERGGRMPLPLRSPAPRILMLLVALGCMLTPAMAQRRGGLVQRYLRLDTIELIDIPAPRMAGAIARSTPGGLLLYLPDTISDPHRLTIRVKRGHTWGAIPLELPDSVIVDAHNPLSDCVAPTDSTVVLLAWNHLLRFTRRSGTWECSGCTRLSRGYRLLWLDGGDYVLGQDMLVDPLSRPHPVVIASVDARSLRVIREHELPDPSGIAYTLFQPRQLLDVTDGSVALADADRYRIRIFDHDAHLDTILERAPSGWAWIAAGAAAEIAGKPLKQIIDELGGSVARGSLVRGVSFIDDSTLLVSYALPGKIPAGVLRGKQETRVDIWRHTARGWRPIALELENYSPSLTSPVTPDGPYPLSYRFRCEHGLALSAEALPVACYGKTWERIIADANDYLTDNDPRLSLVVQRWSIP